MDRFEFISDEISERQIAINLLRSNAGEQLNRVDSLCPDTIDNVNDPGFSWPENLSSDIRKLIPYFDLAEELIQKLQSEDQEQILADLKKLSEVRGERVQYLAELRAAIERGEILADVEPGILQADSIITAETLESQMTSIQNDRSSPSRSKDHPLECRELRSNRGRHDRRSNLPPRSRRDWNRYIRTAHTTL